jgi:hypothetical protein
MRFFVTLLLIVLLAAAGAYYFGFKPFMNTFTALDSEAPIAKVNITQAQNGDAPRHQRYFLVAEYANGTTGSYEVAGDYFLLEAEVVTLKGWAAALGGGEARARLTRLEGRFNQAFETAVQLCLKDGDQPSRKYWDAAEPCLTQYDIKDAHYKAAFKGTEGLIPKIGEYVLNVSKSERNRLPFRSGAGVDLVNAASVWICLTEDALVVRRPDEGCKGAESAPVAVEPAPAQ